MSNELYHFGIKGQKWGVRRFQNKDGSLTPAGMKRYNDSVDDSGTAEKEKFHLSDKQKKYLKVGAAVVGTTLAVHGVKKFSKNIKIENENVANEVLKKYIKNTTERFNKAMEKPMMDLTEGYYDLVEGEEKYKFRDKVRRFEHDMTFKHLLGLHADGRAQIEKNLKNVTLKEARENVKAYKRGEDVSSRYIGKNGHEEVNKLVDRLTKEIEQLIAERPSFTDQYIEENLRHPEKYI